MSYFERIMWGILFFTSICNSFAIYLNSKTIIRMIERRDR